MPHEQGPHPHRLCLLRHHMECAHGKSLQTTNIRLAEDHYDEARPLPIFTDEEKDELKATLCCPKVGCADHKDTLGDGSY